VQVLGDVRTGFGDVRRAKNVCTWATRPTLRASTLWKDRLGGTRQAIGRARALTDAQDSARLDSLTSALNISTYAGGFRGLAERVEIGELDDPWAANRAMQPLADSLQQIDSALAALSASFSQRAQERHQTLSEAGAQAPWLVLGVTVVVALLSAVLVLAIVRSILQPIRELQAVAHAWGRAT